MSKKSVEEEIRSKGQKTPLDFLLMVMNNRRAHPSSRIEAAKAAAPYVHRKMPTDIELSGEIGIIPPYLPGRSQLELEFKESERMIDITPSTSYITTMELDDL